MQLNAVTKELMDFCAAVVNCHGPGLRPLVLRGMYARHFPCGHMHFPCGHMHFPCGHMHFPCGPMHFPMRSTHVFPRPRVSRMTRRLGICVSPCARADMHSPYGPPIRHMRIPMRAPRRAFPVWRAHWTYACPHLRRYELALTAASFSSVKRLNAERRRSASPECVRAYACAFPVCARYACAFPVCARYAYAFRVCPPHSTYAYPV